MKIGLLTCRTYAGAYENEVALAAEMDKKFQVDVLIWNDTDVDWSSYNYLIFKSIWDYFEYPAAFLAWIDILEKNHIKTLNPLHIIKQNQHKFYLRDLQQQGIDIIPTVFIPKNTGLDLSFLKDNNWERAVIKPAVSGGAYLTKLFSQSQISEIEAEYLPIAQERDLLVQPFMPEIQTMGEISLLFFRGIFSHAVLKKPIGDDYRVQSQFGGQYQTYFPTDTLIETAKNMTKRFGNDLLYARVDGILKNNKFLLMEVELIEPDLYFNHAPNAKKMYLKALEAMITESEPFYSEKS
jgi:hypothetical protein